MTTTVTLAPDELAIEPAGLDKLWSFTSRLVIPLDHVRGATHDPGMKRAPKGWRGPGLRLGDKLSGTFHADGDDSFHSPEEAMQEAVHVGRSIIDGTHPDLSVLSLVTHGY